MLGSAVYLVRWIDINIMSSRKISEEPHIIIVIKQFKVIVPEAIYCFCHWSAKWSMGLCRYIAKCGKRKGFSTIPFLCYYKKFKGNFFLFGYYHNRYLVRDWSMTHAKISSGVQHRVYILHVLRIKDKQKKLSSKCFEKLSTWLKCHNFFATPWKFLILSNMYWGQIKRF